MSFTRVASASENACTPPTGNPEFPVTKCLIAVRPYSALTSNGSAKNTPVKKGRRTRSYVFPRPLFLSSSPTLAAGFLLRRY